jgi:hypothetical protein
MPRSFACLLVHGERCRYETHIRASLFFRRHVIVSSSFLRTEKIGYEPLQTSSMRLTNSQRQDAAVGFKIMRGSSVEGLQSGRYFLRSGEAGCWGVGEATGASKLKNASKWEA